MSTCLGCEGRRRQLARRLSRTGRTEVGVNGPLKKFTHRKVRKIEARVGPTEGSNLKLCHASYIEIDLVCLISHPVQVLKVDTMKLTGIGMNRLSPFATSCARHNRGRIEIEKRWHLRDARCRQIERRRGKHWRERIPKGGTYSCRYLLCQRKR